MTAFPHFFYNFHTVMKINAEIQKILMMDFRITLLYKILNFTFGNLTRQNVTGKRVSFQMAERIKTRVVHFAYLEVLKCFQPKSRLICGCLF